MGTAGGSLKEVRPGVWRSRVVVGYAPNGAPKQHSETYKTGKRDAEKRHADHVTRAGAGEVSTATDTVCGYLSGWLDQRAGTWAATTERRNRQAVAKVTPKLASIKLSQLKRGDIQEWVDGLSGSAGTVRRDHITIQGALQDAVDGEKVGLAKNPARGVRLPEGNDPEANPPEDDEVVRILQTAGARGQLWRDLFTLAANTGLRRGELCGLRWCDLSSDLSTITINQAVECLVKSESGATWRLKDTKTHQVRGLPLPKAAVRALQRRRGNGQPDPTAFVFSEDDGVSIIHPDHVSRVFAKVANAADLSGYKLKDFRSYAATVLTEEVGLAVAQAFLGHASATTTARHYTNARKSAMAGGVAAFDRLDHEQTALGA